MTAPEVVSSDGACLSIWRDAPSLNGARTASLGAFRCDTAAAGASLIRTAMDRLRGEGFEAVLGPMDGNTWDGHRLVVESDGRPPFLMEPSNPEHYVAAFEASGLDVVSRYVSSERPANVPAGNSTSVRGVVLRNLDPTCAEDELRRIHAMSLLAFANNAFYTPITQEAFLASYRPILPVVDPELVFVAEDESGELCGFLFAIPNLAEGASSQSVILKTYASSRKGVGSMLANAFHIRARAKGFSRVVHALMHESNLSATHSSNTGGKVFRRYALWGGPL